MNKRVLLTGIAGFIGHHVMSHLLANTDWDIIGIASWTHKGEPERIIDDRYYQENKDRVTIITHDLSSPLPEILKKKIGKVDYILNIASDSHVDRSITDPVPLVKNNVNLVLNMLELAKEIKPELFLQFSTDETYGAAPGIETFKEWSTILPSNPYSASKAAQEAIAYSYWRTYGVPLIITNLVNVFGERQDKEKFMCKCISKIANGESITIHGSENNIGSRFYIHARNVADALLFIVRNVKPIPFSDCVDRPERLNITSDTEIDNLTVAEMIAAIMGKTLKYKLEDFHKTRPGHDRRYGLDGSKLKALGWKMPYDFETSLTKYVNWSIKPENKKWL
jgi:dTDP-glucose 4,6-dehydratase